LTTENSVEIRDLRVSYPGPRRSAARLNVVKDVNLEIRRGECLGLVGESGSGKSTIARAVMRLIDIDAGEVLLGGEPLTSMGRKELLRKRREIQMVFQDPYSSLDPSMMISESISEPLKIHENLSKGDLSHRVHELLKLVGLAPHHASRYPYEFSGGQRQRIAIARAIAVHPSVLICDEAVSALDVSTQNQIIGLLKRLREELGLSFLFISHDIAVVRHIANRVAVMYFGSIVEVGEVEQILHRPAHPYTQDLLSSVPVPNPVVQRARVRNVVRGEIPDLSSTIKGCAFLSRCLHSTSICAEEKPPLRDVGGAQVACHNVEEVPRPEIEW
jgi:oligopeptide/dipeptide ABC transporter ATP-binding protein